MAPATPAKPPAWHHSASNLVFDNSGGDTHSHCPDSVVYSRTEVIPKATQRRRFHCPLPRLRIITCAPKCR